MITDAGNSIDPTKPGPDADRPSPEPQDVRVTDAMIDAFDVATGNSMWKPMIREGLEAALAQSDAQPMLGALNHIARLTKQRDALIHVLQRCRMVLHNMAMENEGAIFNRWPIHHEPLRSDAKHLLPLIDGTLDAIPEPDTTPPSLPEGAREALDRAFSLINDDTNWTDKTQLYARRCLATELLKIKAATPSSAGLIEAAELAELMAAEESGDQGGEIYVLHKLAKRLRSLASERAGQ